MNLVFDLDGTIIDSRQRLHTLFQRLVPTSDLSFDEYWALKRNKISHENILAERFGFDSVAVEGFRSKWMALIESTELLALDTVLPGIQGALARLGQEATLHLCTARQFSEKAIAQLKRLNLLHHFSSVMVTGGVRSKSELVGAISTLGPDDWFLTDTGRDIRVGQALGMKTCAVLSGFLSEARLKEYNPDFIVPSVADFNVERSHLL